MESAVWANYACESKTKVEYREKFAENRLSVRSVGVGVAESLKLRLVHRLQNIFVDRGQFGLFHSKRLVEILRIQWVLLQFNK